MKNKIMVLLLGGVMVFAAVGCEKYADTQPGLTVYKTKGDYFYNVSAGLNKGRIFGYPSFHNNRNNTVGRGMIITKDDTIYTGRARLINGYIVSEEIGKGSIFVDFTFKEYLKYEIENSEIGGVTSSVLKENILDDDPFLEVYYDRNRPRKYELPDTILINQMIRDGELEKYFVRVK